MAILTRTRRFTLDEYHRMGEASILTEDDRVELIEGEIVELTPIGPLHASTVTRIQRTLGLRLGERAIVWVQNPIALAREGSEPQPDLVLLRPHADLYARALPQAADAFLLIEVMDTSAAHDRHVKLPLYARAAIPEVWLVDLDPGHLEIHRRPQGGAYADTWIARRGDTLAPSAFPDIVLSVTDLVG